ncbi:PilZ domain-containing protein [Kangiella geojedonensis]|uniref:PilZ domain-containing protein n=1 Tax=Kangiella geojedonensis TaxID=914150 RepID=UPI000A07B24B|nr:PilZ domain-containing protein [Kangiella geojedonensis]
MVFKIKYLPSTTPSSFDNLKLPIESQRNCAINTERRQFTRVPVTAKALIEQDGEKYIAKVADISLNGAHLQTASSLKKENPIKLQLIFDELTPPIHMMAKIVYHNGEDYGVECQEIDIDSMLQLRSILTLYNNDPETIHQESQALWERNTQDSE